MKSTHLEDYSEVITEFEVLSGRLAKEFHINIEDCEAFKIYTELISTQKRLQELETIRQEVLKATC